MLPSGSSDWSKLSPEEREKKQKAAQEERERLEKQAKEQEARGYQALTFLGKSSLIVAIIYIGLACTNEWDKDDLKFGIAFSVISIFAFLLKLFQKPQ